MRAGELQVKSSTQMDSSGSSGAFPLACSSMLFNDKLNHHDAKSALRI